MAISRTKTWISGEVLTSSDLNTEFNNILTNALSLISPLTGALDVDGYTLTLDAAGATQVVSSAAVSWNFTSGAKTGTPATTGSVSNWSAQTFTDSATAGSGTATAFVAHSFKKPTLAATNSSVVTTNAATVYVEGAPTAGTNETLTNALALWVDDGISRFDGAVNMFKGADIASATTTNLTTATGNLVHITGTTTITGVTLGSGMMRQVIFDDALTLTHHATNNNLPYGANITTAAGDRALYWSDGTTVYCVSYFNTTAAAARTTLGAAASTDVCPVADTIAVVKGSADATKLLRIEVDGFTTGTTRVLTPPDADLTLPAVTAAGDILQASASGVLAKLALGAAGTRLHSTGSLAEWQGTWFKSGSFTRDVSTASGTQAVTGVGFKPKAVIFIAGFTTPSGQTSIGFSDGTNHFDAYDNFGVLADTWGVITSQCISLVFTGVNSYTGVVSALGSDGFTITWTKGGTPTGTATIGYLALR